MKETVAYHVINLRPGSKTRGANRPARFVFPAVAMLRHTRFRSVTCVARSPATAFTHS